MDSLSGVVLAGGESRRMGRDKAFLELGERLLIEMVIERVASIADEVIVVASTPEQYKHLSARVVGDVYRGVGVLGGLHAGLAAATHELAVAVGCDMPFLDPPLLRYLVSLAPGHDAVVPRLNDYVEPLHAVYARTCLPYIEARIKAGARRVVSFYTDVRVRYVERKEWAPFDPELRSLRNVNTPEEWEEARRQVIASEEERGREQYVI